MTSNPRFPHTCKITRSLVNDPLVDSFNSPLQDGEEAAEPKEKLMYEGECRSFNRDTVSDNGDVVTSYRKLALPLKQDEWTEDNAVREGDIVEVQKFGYTERGIVIDIYPSNLGIHIIWKYARN